MEVEDGREEIDSLLDEAGCCLANVSQKMHDYWIRALKEREVEEARLARKASMRAGANIVRVDRQTASAKGQLTKMLKKDPALRALIKEHLSSISEGGSDGSMEERDEENQEDCSTSTQGGNGLCRALL
jgi:hypothetical protein